MALLAPAVTDHLYAMRFSSDPEARLIVGGLVAIVVAIHFVAEWIDRRTEPPIMKKRINEGSDEYFANRKSTLDTAVDEARDFLRPPY